MRSEYIKFCPRCGAPVQTQFHFGRERPICPSCGWVHFADPKVAAAVLVESEGRVLLVQRANDPFKGCWTVPAGFVDAGEDPAEAAVRECFEETGLTVQITGLIEIIAGREHPRGSDFVIFYRGQAEGGELNAGDDASAAGWFERGNLPQLAFQSTAYLLTRH
jgi:8-oxo-dGTP diphosphatase